MEPHEKQRDIFFSYANEDREILNRLISEIEKISKKIPKLKISYYLDVNDFSLGDDLINAISRGILNAHYVVMLISPSFLEKKYPLFEWGLCAENKKHIIPLWLNINEIDIAKRFISLANKVSFSLSTDTIPTAAKEILKHIFPDYRELKVLGDTKILISTESDFTRELHTKLCKKMKMEMQIKMENLYIPTKKSKKSFEKTYMDGLEKFFNDKDAVLLYSVLFEEGNRTFKSDDARNLIDRLEKAKKKIIFFESGMNFLELVKDKKEKPIFVIKTNHKNAVEQLIEFVINEYMLKNKKIHFITILGPMNNPAAIERRTLFNDFLSQLVKNRGLKDAMFKENINLDDPSAVLSHLNTIETLQITTLRINSWLRKDAQIIIENFYSEFPLPDITSDNSFHHCFLCGNDDIALGVYDAIDNKSSKDVKNLNVSFIGFDGISEMVKGIENNNINGATIKVFIDEMCDKALEIKRDITNLREAEQKINGDIIRIKK
jgi:hypothetical protein